MTVGSPHAICTFVDVDAVLVCGVSNATVERRADGRWLCKQHQPDPPKRDIPAWMRTPRRTF